MKRRVTPFSIGLSLGLLLIGLGVVATVFYTHQALALSNKGADNTDFPPSSHYTLSATADVAGASTMTVAVFVPGAKPAAGVTVSVTYQADVSAGPACDDNNHQGWAGDTFSGTGITYSGNDAASGIPTRPTTVTIATGAWVADGTGFKALLTGNLTTMTHSCGSAGGDGNHVNFTLTAPAAYTLGPAGGKRFAVNQGTYGVTFNSTYPAGVSSQGYTTYKVPFAPACTQTTGGSTSVQIYDMDNRNNPVVQPTPAVVKIMDITGGLPGTPVNSNAYTPFPTGEDNGNTATFTFTFQPQHSYQLLMTNVNLNNILQIQLPFDSVNAIINCAPKGDITSSASSTCTNGEIDGYAYDPTNTSAALQIYVDTNPPSAPATTLSSAPSGFDGPFTANQPNPSGTPGGTPIGHGFEIDIPSDVAGNAWTTNTYYVYAKDSSTSTITELQDSPLTVTPCASVSCGTTNFGLDSVGDPDSFTVNMVLHGATTPPPGSPKFSITVTGSGVGTNSQTFNNVASNGVTSGSVYSSTVQFTPAGAGNYSVTWSYFGQSGCGAPPSTASYTPYFGVTAGNIAAGAGFGNGSCSNGSSNAQIESWNTGAPDYNGAGSELGALATDDITDFVSGMGLSGGAASQSAGQPLTFANASNNAGTPPANYGHFGSITCIDDYYGTKAAANPTNLAVALNNAEFGTLNGAYTASPIPAFPSAVMLGDAAHTPISIPQSKTITLYVHGNVYIDSNITYGAYSLTTVPRFNLYVQGNIYIDPSVTELHGVYIAQAGGSPGNITTCSDGVHDTGTEPYATCNKALLVVGAMAAQGQLRLTRTHGNLVGVPAANVPAEPAEVFQYSPELWLNAPTQNATTIKAYTSLPPVL